MAKQRVAKRVSNGGHNIPDDVIERRYYRGIQNLINLYNPLCDNWIVINNTSLKPEIVIQGKTDDMNTIFNAYIWNKILQQSTNHGQ
ncbi:hypothetical protein [Mucilaginibacter robiniae]|uniref:hypothetical protein n=1 Tax=Mucilaginibacter robiniae TaxID=2728022 RepID=UPI002006DE6E|nr:hypothetical protein [Mucilaginibacter robiniae]